MSSDDQVMTTTYLLSVDCPCQEFSSFLQKIAKTRTVLRDCFFEQLCTKDVRAFQRHYEEILIALDGQITATTILVYKAILQAHKHAYAAFNKMYVRHYPAEALDLIAKSGVSLRYVNWSYWRADHVKSDLLSDAGFRAHLGQVKGWAKDVSQRESRVGQVQTCASNFNPYAAMGVRVRPTWSTDAIQVSFDVNDAVLSADGEYVYVCRYKIMPNISDPDEMCMAFYSRRLTPYLDRFTDIDLNGAPSINEIATIGVRQVLQGDHELQQLKTTAVLHELLELLDNRWMPVEQRQQVDNLVYAVVLENALSLNIMARCLMGLLLGKLAKHLLCDARFYPVYVQLLIGYAVYGLPDSSAFVRHPLATIIAEASELKRTLRQQHNIEIHTATCGDTDDVPDLIDLEEVAQRGRCATPHSNLVDYPLDSTGDDSLNQDECLSPPLPESPVVSAQRYWAWPANTNQIPFLLQEYQIPMVPWAAAAVTPDSSDWSDSSSDSSNHEDKPHCVIDMSSIDATGPTCDDKDLRSDTLSANDGTLGANDDTLNANDDHLNANDDTLDVNENLNADNNGWYHKTEYQFGNELTESQYQEVAKYYADEPLEDEISRQFDEALRALEPYGPDTEDEIAGHFDDALELEQQEQPRDELDEYYYGDVVATTTTTTTTTCTTHQALETIYVPEDQDDNYNIAFEQHDTQPQQSWAEHTELSQQPWSEENKPKQQLWSEENEPKQQQWTEHTEPPQPQWTEHNERPWAMDQNDTNNQQRGWWPW